MSIDQKRGKRKRKRKAIGCGGKKEELVKGDYQMGPLNLFHMKTNDETNGSMGSGRGRSCRRVWI